jgi:hypothetical protein
MVTEIYLEGHALDLTKDISSLLTFAIDDIKDFSSRQTTFSKTIVLPGTANNNKVFGHIFQPGQSNAFDPAQNNVGYNFNAAKSADCIIFQDQLQTFKGVLRLLQINDINGRFEYEVSVFGKLAGLNAKLSGSLLEDLDFSAYDHVFNTENIVNSWDNPGGTGIYYPLIDYGTYSVNKHDWDIRTFRPAVYVYEIINKMFQNSDFRWSSDLFESPRFKKLIIPHNQKHLTKNSQTSLRAENGFAHLETDTAPDALFAFLTATLGFFTTNINKTEFTYTASVAQIFTIAFTVYGEIAGIGNPNQSVQISVLKNGVSIQTQIIPSPGHFDPFNFSKDFSVNTNIEAGDIISIQVLSINNNDYVNANIDLLTITTSSAIPVLINIGDPILMNDTLPRNIRQIDFLVSIVKMFNLYVYEDRLDASLIHLKPYINFYENSHNSAVDWTYKLNRNKVKKIKPMSELNAKKYEFKFKPDNDYYNELYKKRYNQGYGDRIYDSEFEFTDQTKAFEVIFSATPLVGYVGEEKVYPTIFKQSNNNEETVDSNIRILQTTKVTGVALWNITTNSGATVLNSLTRYGYAGHFNDPNIPTDDLNFGVPKELFFTLATGDLRNTQFNVYWSGYMAEITDKDSKLLTGNFYLTPKDIIDLDFSRFVYLDGVLFRLNEIKDYNASKLSDCLVELLKVNSANFTEAADNNSPPDGNFLLWNDGNTLDFDDGAGNELLYRSSDSVLLNWQFDYSAALSATFRIYVNATLVAIVDNQDGAGSLSVVPGDVVKVDVVASPHGIKKILTVDSDIDGNLYNGSSSISNKSYQWTALDGRIYTIFGQTTI